MASLLMVYLTQMARNNDVRMVTNGEVGELT